MKKAAIPLLLFVSFVEILAAQRFTCQGYIRNVLTDAPLSFAMISNGEEAVYADEMGHYQFSFFSMERDTLSYTMLGFSPMQLIWPYDSLQMSLVHLTPNVELPAIIVRAPASVAPGGSIMAVDIATIKRLPTLGGEIDYIKGLTLLPGISAGVEGTANLNIRGGEPEQTQLLIDGSPVYNANHLGGFLSAIPPGAVKQITAYKGGVPARLGGRLSGVIDVQLKESIPEKAATDLLIGTGTAGITFHTPVNKNISILASGRFAYPSLLIDLLNASTFEKGVSGDKTNVYVNDVIIKIVNRPSERLTTSFTWFQSSDKGYIQESSGNVIQENFDKKNQTASFRMGYSLSNAWHLKANAYFSNFKYHYQREEDIVYRRDSIVHYSREATHSRIRDFGLRVALQRQFSNTFFFETGTDYVYHSFSASNQGSAAFSNELFNQFSNDNNALEHAYFASLQAQILQNKFVVHGGMRLSTLGTGKATPWYAEPRLRLEYKFSGGLSINANVERHTQYLHRLQANGSLFPNEVWVLANSKAIPSTSDQWSLGISQRSNKVEWYVELFHKQLRNLIQLQFEAGNIYGFERDWTDLIYRDGKGSAKGAEFFFTGSFKKWKPSLAYTLMSSTRRFADINNGNEFPFIFDRRHDINASLTFTPSSKWEYSVLFVYQTGNAATIPIAIGNGVLLYNDINGFRMPSYQRLDTGITRNWEKNEKRKVGKFLRLSIYNTLNRLNAQELSVRPVRREVKNPITMVEETETSWQLYQVGFFPIIPGLTFGMNF
ncbi:MAG: TonB-dependent receptor [Saprospiraceae bacterium]